MENKSKEIKKSKQALLFAPFVLLIVAMIIGFGGGALLFMYGFISAIAFNSAMIGLLLFASSFILIAIGIGMIDIFNKYKIRYAKKLGNAVEIKEKAVTHTANSTKSLKEYITLSNISLAILAVGAVLTLVSALLGCTDRTTWIDTTAKFKQDNGYYADTQHPISQYPINASDNDISKIEIDLTDKVGIIVYNNDFEKFGKIVVETFVKYPFNVVISRTKDGTLKINDNPSPKKDNALNDLLFFVFDDSSIESQVIVYIPRAYEGKIEIIGDNLIYANPSK